MQDYKQITVLIAAVGITLIACLAATSVFAKDASPLAMMAIFGAIIIGVLLVAKGPGFVARFRVKKSGEVDSALEVSQLRPPVRKPRQSPRRPMQDA